MERELVIRFIDKLIEIFQSNYFYKKNILPWLNLLFTHHFFILASIDNNKINSLKQIQTLINTRTKNLGYLLQVQSKLENLINLFDKKEQINNKSTNQNSNYEPLLVYNESDSEEENKNSKYYI
jgi:cell division protein FtsB